MRVTDCTVSDAGDICRLEKECIECAWSEKDISAALASSDYTFVKAEYGNEFAGYAGMRLVLDTAEICNVAVKPAFRRRGIGRGLMEALLQRVFSSGATSVYLEVAEDNTAAIGLYSSLGFTEVYKRKRYYGEKSAYVMKLSR